MVAIPTGLHRRTDRQDGHMSFTMAGLLLRLTLVRRLVNLVSLVGAVPVGALG